MSSVTQWSWLFFALYAGIMLLFGVIGMRRIHGSDDFATARASYGPIFLAFAMTATAASGATFLGLPGLAYQAGFSAIGYALVYPLGIYVGVLICLRAVRRIGADFGSRSMPEYLGYRYQSNGLRLLAAAFSVLLLIYLAGQILAGALMFTKLLGLDLMMALIVSALVLAFYVSLGGAHADILTDGVQGALMLVLALGVLTMFLTGFGTQGGLAGVHQQLEATDPNLVAPLNPALGLFDSYWDLLAIFLAHLPLGLLPHIGNKLWALRSDRDQRLFITLAFVFGLILPLITLGGILARVVLGDALFQPGETPNNAIPALFLATLPSWAAAAIGVGVLAAVMSTADGLVISTSQIFANDLFRLSIAPGWLRDWDDDRVDRLGLRIGRVATVLILVVATWLAWETRERNVALLVWVGLGGMMAATAAPMFLGVLWRRATLAGSYAGFVTGAVVFTFLHSGALDGGALVGLQSLPLLALLADQAPNPYTCSALGMLSGAVVMVAVSLLTKPPEDAHLARVCPH